MLFKKALKIWIAIKSKIWNVPHHIRIVQPMNLSENVESSIETEQLSTFYSIWRLIDAMANIVGVNSSKETKISPKIVVTTLMLCFSYSSLFYTIFLVWHNIPTLLETICLFGVLVPGTKKYRLVVKEMKNVTVLKNFFEKILTGNSKGSRANQLAREMKSALKISKMFIAISTLCFAAFSLYPIQAFVTENRLVPLMRLEFPFIDQTNAKGYVIGLAIMLVLGFIGYIGTVAYDLMILVLLLQYGSLVTQLKEDLVNYHELWKKKDTISERYRNQFLRNICLKYGDINSYIRYFDRVFAGNTRDSVCMLYASLICAVYAVFNTGDEYVKFVNLINFLVYPMSSVQNGWISGYGFCIFCLIQLYLQCILGTYVAIQNNKINQALYFTPWYEYPVKVQQTILSLLHASAFNAKVLRIGLFAPLNVATGLQLTKSIYSFYTAMTNL